MQFSVAIDNRRNLAASQPQLFEMVDQLEGSAVVAGLASRFRVDGRGTQAGTGNQLATIRHHHSPADDPGCEGVPEDQSPDRRTMTDAGANTALAW